MLIGLAIAAIAAVPHVERPRESSTFGVNLVYGAGPRGPRSRFGVAVDLQQQFFWAQEKEKSGAPLFATGPFMTVSAHVGWTPPVVWAEATGVAGVMYPAQIGMRGFDPLVAAQAGGGVHLGTDGAAGPVLVGALVGPRVEARLEVTHFRGWYHPRLLLGGTYSLTCCWYLR